MKNDKIQKIGRRVIEIEKNAISSLITRINEDFTLAVKYIIDCNGRIMISGMGKSGLIAQKVASTMASTGTPAYFIHPGEAIHGDLGMITNKDICILMSNSGETEELLSIIPSIKNMGVKIIALTGEKQSTIARISDVFIDVSVEKEACTLDLAPTASSTALLAMGDALAISILEIKGFDKEDFAILHPGGSLGKRLILKVDQLCSKDDNIPFIYTETSIKDALLEISEKGLGSTGVLDDNENLVGIITDGDIRRGLGKNGDVLLKMNAIDIMSKDPKYISSDTLAIDALEMMEKYAITTLFSYSHPKLKKPDGIVHIHTILKSGI